MRRFLSTGVAVCLVAGGAIATGLRVSPYTTGGGSGGSGGTYTGAAPIDVTGSVISCIPASGVVGGCVAAGTQVLPGGKTFSSDGGQSSGVVAGNFRAQYAPHGTTSGPWQDGGAYNLGGFNCGNPPGLTGNGLWEHGVPCVTDYTGPMEVTANYPDIYYDGDDICTIELTTPPQNPRAAGCNLTVMNGPQKNFWVRHDGSMWTLGDIVFHRSGGHSISVDQSPGSITLRGNIPSNIGFTYGAVYSTNNGTEDVNTYIHNFYNGGQPQAAVDYGGSVEVHVSEATVAWDHQAAFAQYGKDGVYQAPFGLQKGNEWGHKQDCPAKLDGGGGTIAYFVDAGWGVCDTTGWHKLSLVP